jgi:hypothetical protein
MQAGTRLACPECTTEVIVIRPPNGDVRLACGGAGLVDIGAPRGADGHGTAAGDTGTLLGKRYIDEEVAIELLCTKAGAGMLSCEGRLMTVKGAKPLPSSD